MQVDGVSACRCGCGRLELDYVLWMTGGVHWQCFQEGALERLREVAVLHNGALIKIPLSKKNPPRKGKPRIERGVRDNARLAHAAREAARKRLAQAEAELYDVFYNDERRKRGLPIVPKRVTEGRWAEVIKTKTERLAYHPADVSPAPPTRPHG